MEKMELSEALKANASVLEGLFRLLIKELQWSLKSLNPILVCT
ncbi:hypothetical protein NXY07_04565 [Phocaeicola dorei]|nr:hypothetical protein [Phocaeicola dorei]